jgi:hypothetical protein
LMERLSLINWINSMSIKIKPNAGNWAGHYEEYYRMNEISRVDENWTISMLMMWMEFITWIQMTIG